MDPITQIEKLIVSLDDILNSISQLKSDLGFKESDISCELAKYIANSICTTKIDILGIIPKLHSARTALVSFVKDTNTSASASAAASSAGGRRRQRIRRSRSRKTYIKKWRLHS
jgi:hypothetical protein